MQKRVIKLFTNFEREEEWLNEMSAQGWHCRGYVFGRYLFERGEPGEYIYRIQLLEYPADHAQSAAYLDFLQDAGVEVVASCFRWVYLRKKAAEGPFELFSDLESRVAHYRRIVMMLLPLALANAVFSLRIFSDGGNRLSQPNRGRSSGHPHLQVLPENRPIGKGKADQGVKRSDYRCLQQ